MIAYISTGPITEARSPVRKAQEALSFNLGEPRTRDNITTVQIPWIQNIPTVRIRQYFGASQASTRPTVQKTRLWSRLKVAIKFEGVNAVTNFELNRYDLKAIGKSSLPAVFITKFILPGGGMIAVGFVALLKQEVEAHSQGLEKSNPAPSAMVRSTNFPQILYGLDGYDGQRWTGS
ncbi:hypothetical protein AgCh_006281 [Apium graveolens]